MMPFVKYTKLLTLTQRFHDFDTCYFLIRIKLEDNIENAQVAKFSELDIQSSETSS